MKAAIYTRVSSERQAGEDRTSLQTQLQDCRALAEKEGLEVVAELRDVATGTSRTRKGYLRLCDLVRQGAVDAVVAWAEDRLYRGFGVLPFYEALQDRPELRVFLCHGAWDRSLMAIMAGIAQKELEDIRRRMLRGRLASLQAGKVPGGDVPLGYKRGEDGRPEVDPEGAEIVRTIFRLYAEDFTILQIADALTAKGHKPRKGGQKWDRGTVEGALARGDLYAGLAPKVYRLGEHRVEVPFPRILSAGLHARWAETRDRNRDRAHVGARSGNLPALLRGLVTDACGWTWRYHHEPRFQRSRRHDRYVCIRHVRQGTERPPACGVSYLALDLERRVWDQLVAILSDESALEAVAAKARAEARDSVDALEDDLKRLERREAELARQRQWVLDMARESLLDPEDLRRQLATVEDPLRLVRVERQRIAERVQLARASLDEMDKVLEALGRYTLELGALGAKLPRALPPDLDEPVIVHGREGHEEVYAYADLWTLFGADRVWVEMQAGTFPWKGSRRGDWTEADALRYAQFLRKRELVRRFVSQVYVGPPDQEPRVRIAFRFAPQEVIHSNVWWQEALTFEACC